MISIDIKMFTWFQIACELLIKWLQTKVQIGNEKREKIWSDLIKYIFCSLFIVAFFPLFMKKKTSMWHFVVFFAAIAYLTSINNQQSTSTHWNFQNWIIINLINSEMGTKSGHCKIIAYSMYFHIRTIVSGTKISAWYPASGAHLIQAGFSIIIDSWWYESSFIPFLSLSSNGFPGPKIKNTR